MNDYDKAGRYIVKSDPSRIFPWLLRSPTVVFQAWIDARRIAMPDQHDLTNDLVGAVEQDGVVEAVCLELEAEARADAVPRALGYVFADATWRRIQYNSGLAGSSSPPGGGRPRPS